MDKCFEKSVEGALNLTRRQIGQIRDEKRLQARTIFLSGGLSRSDYFYERVRNFARGFQSRINVLRGPTGLEQRDGAEVFSSWTAVARGGLLIGLGLDCEVPSPSLPSPFHLGFVLSERFALYEHPSEARYTDTFDNLERARNHVKWVVSKGDLVPPGRSIHRELKLVQKMSQPAQKPGSVGAVLCPAGAGLSAGRFDFLMRGYYYQPFVTEVELVRRSGDGGGVDVDDVERLTELVRKMLFTDQKLWNNARNNRFTEEDRRGYMHRADDALAEVGMEVRAWGDGGVRGGWGRVEREKAGEIKKLVEEIRRKRQPR